MRQSRYSQLPEKTLSSETVHSSLAGDLDERQEVVGGQVKNVLNLNLI